ncbi:hypothetical protein V8C26DRAFT_326408 [Trichoderma gracile]
MGNRRLIFICLSLDTFLGWGKSLITTIFLFPLLLLLWAVFLTPALPRSFSVASTLSPRGLPPLDDLMGTNHTDGSMAIHSVIMYLAASLEKARRSSQEDFFVAPGRGKTSLSRAVRFKAKSARPTGVRRSSWSADGNLGPSPPKQCSLLRCRKSGPRALTGRRGYRRERANAGSVTVWLTESRDALERSGCGRGRATLGDKKVLDSSVGTGGTVLSIRSVAICELPMVLERNRTKGFDQSSLRPARLAPL